MSEPQPAPCRQTEEPTSPAKVANQQVLQCLEHGEFLDDRWSTQPPSTHVAVVLKKKKKLSRRALGTQDEQTHTPLPQPLHTVTHDWRNTSLKIPWSHATWTYSRIIRGERIGNHWMVTREAICCAELSLFPQGVPQVMSHEIATSPQLRLAFSTPCHMITSHWDARDHSRNQLHLPHATMERRL